MSKTLTFDLIQFHKAYTDFVKGKSRTGLELRELKKKYFKGTAFNAAFPLSGLALPQRWKLKGVATVDDEEYEFKWEPDGCLTFDDFFIHCGVAWADAMLEAVPKTSEPSSILCTAYVF